MSYSNRVIDYKYLAPVDNRAVDLERCNRVKDVGVPVIVDSKLSFTDLITEEVHKLYSIHGIITRNFHRVPTGPGKSWNFGGPFSRPGKSWKTAKVMENHGNSWKMMIMSWNLYNCAEKF